MKELHEQLLEISTPSGSIVRGDVRWESDNHPHKRPLVIVCHGFRAFKDWGPFPEIGRFFARNGFVSFVFNFSYNGIGGEPRKFSEPEKFSVNTFSLDLSDVESILSAADRGALGKLADLSRIGIVGHSRGGGIAIIKGKEEERIKAVAAWSSVAYFNRYTDEQKKRWREKGFVQLSSTSPSNFFRVKTDLLDDLEIHSKRLNIIEAAEHLQKPLLIVHGSADIPVRLEEARRLFEASDKTLTEFIVIDGASHMYGAKHPYKKESTDMIRVLELTSSWFHKHL